MTTTTTIVLLLVFSRLVESSPPSILASGTMQVRGGSIEDLPGLIKDLYSSDQEERRVTRLQILSIANQSEDARTKISHELTALISQQETPSGTWYDAADLLGALEATEAIGELVRQLDYNDGTVGLSTSHWPAVRALIKIGDAAIPELGRALTDGTTSIRKHAARALAGIRGAQARQVLERALLIEEEESVRETIRRALVQAP